MYCMDTDAIQDECAPAVPLSDKIGFYTVVTMARRPSLWLEREAYSLSPPGSPA